MSSTFMPSNNGKGDRYNAMAIAIGLPPISQERAELALRNLPQKAILPNEAIAAQAQYEQSKAALANSVEPYKNNMDKVVDWSIEYPAAFGVTMSQSYREAPNKIATRIFKGLSSEEKSFVQDVGYLKEKQPKAYQVYLNEFAQEMMENALRGSGLDELKFKLGLPVPQVLKGLNRM